MTELCSFFYSPVVYNHCTTRNIKCTYKAIFYASDDFLWNNTIELIETEIRKVNIQDRNTANCTSFI